MLKQIIHLISAFLLVCLILPTTGRSDTVTAKVAIPLITQLVKKSDQNQWYGPLIDAIHELEERSSLTFEIKVVPFKRAVVMTKEGDADFGVFMESTKRNQMAMPIVKLGNATFVIVSLKGSPITRLQDLSGKTLGRILGGTKIKSLSAIEDIHYHHFKTHNDGVKLLTAGRIDALLTADFRVLDAFEQLSLKPTDIARPIPVEDRELWLYWSWKSKLHFPHVSKIKNGPPVTTFNKQGSLGLLESYLKNTTN